MPCETVTVPPAGEQPPDKDGPSRTLMIGGAALLLGVGAVASRRDNNGKR